MNEIHLKAIEIETQSIIQFRNNCINFIGVIIGTIIFISLVGGVFVEIY